MPLSDVSQYCFFYIYFKEALSVRSHFFSCLYLQGINGVNIWTYWQLKSDVYILYEYSNEFKCISKDSPLLKITHYTLHQLYETVRTPCLLSGRSLVCKFYFAILVPECSDDIRDTGVAKPSLVYVQKIFMIVLLPRKDDLHKTL